MQEKLPGLQVLRGLAASLVVILHILHSIDAYFNTSIMVNNHTLAAFLESGVDIFFVISGFIMYSVIRNKFASGYALTFLMNRAFRIIPLYWLLTILYSLLLVLIPSAFNTSVYDTEKLLMSLFFIPHLNASGDPMPLVSVGWTLNFEVYFYICVAAAISFSKKIGMLMILVLFSSGVILGNSFDLPQFMHTISSPLIFEFIFGVVVSMVYFHLQSSTNRTSIAKIVNRPLTGFILLIFIASYWVYIYPVISETSFERVWMWGLPSTLMVVAILLLNNLTRNLKSAIFVGDISYSMYLIQVFTLPAIIKIATQMGLESPEFIVSVALTQYLGTITFAWLCFRLVEQPSNHFLKKFGNSVGELRQAKAYQ